MSREVLSSRPRSGPLTTSCSANLAGQPFKVGTRVPRRNPKGTVLNAPGPHQFDAAKASTWLHKYIEINKQTNKKQANKRTD